jgi:hypothetical protein
MATYGELRTPIAPQYAEDTAVVSTVETTVLTFTPGVRTFISGGSFGGSAQFRFKVKLAGVTKSVVRTSAAIPTQHPHWPEGAIDVAAGVAVTVTAFHEEIANQTAQITLLGYTSNLLP